MTFWIILLSFFAGYLFGKYRGETTGYVRGKAEAPLLMRQELLETGNCKLCGRTNILTDYREVE